MAQKINQKQFVSVVKEAITKTLKESGFNGYDMQPQTPITKQQQIDASWQEFNDNNKNRLAQQQQDAKVGSYLDSNINADDLNGQLGMDAMSNDKDVADIAQMTKGTPRQTGQRYDNYLKQKYMESKKQKYNMTESQLNDLIKECITEVLAESTNGLFDVYTSGNGKPVFVTYGGKFYQLPDEMVGMLRELGTKNGRVAFINALQNVPPREKPLDVYSLKMMGYKNRSFNANAF